LGGYEAPPTQISITNKNQALALPNQIFSHLKIMPKKNSSPVALPARMDLAIDSLSDMRIVVLKFPFSKEVQDFCRDIKQVLRSNAKVYAPYRQLNNAILACTSTLTYGFESSIPIDDIPQRQALAVGKSMESIATPAQIYELIYIWAQNWTTQFLNKQANKDEVRSVCDRFLSAIDKIPSDWQWEYIQPETLIKDINTQNGLGYQAIPSLLVSLLHEQTCTISSGAGEQTIVWRKVQGDGSTKTGLHLISQPFKATYYIDDNDDEKEGFFAYRLDFHLQTQAGRLNSSGHLKPWIFVNLSCQRYAHEPLVKNNYGRDISILMGMNKARLDEYPIDSTLVRLTVENNAGKSWQEQLPDVLTAFKARPLVSPSDILNDPIKFGNLDYIDNWERDEYYIVHAEGYGYRQESQKGRGHGHSIKTGFSLKERADIINQIIQLLDGILIPDRSMECDVPTPSGKKLPLAMSDYESHRTSLNPSEIKKHDRTEEEKETYIKAKQIIVANAIKPSFDRKHTYILIIYQERHTRELVRQQLHKAFLIKEGDDFPAHINVIDIFIDNSHLLEKLTVSGLPSTNKDFDKEIDKQHYLKRKEWQAFIQEKIVHLVNDKSNSDLFAIIEIGTSNVKGVHPRQSIRGAVREACVLENINSQMLQTVKQKEKENSTDDASYTKATEGRVLNAVLDLTLRQTGTLYGMPSEIHKVAGISEEIAQQLDLIVFCRVKKNNYIGNTPFQYAVAVRLSATGLVDVLLPNREQWIPYSQAGLAIGKLFHQARKKDKNSLDLVQMKGGQLVKFVADVLSQHLEYPTIALIEADVWRNEGSKGDRAWFQLKNENLLAQRDILNFSHVPGHATYQRDDCKLTNLLGIIRIRSGQETPQYVPNRETWNEDKETSDFTKLSGFIDKTVPELLHYFSVGRIPDTQKKTQHTINNRELYKNDPGAANIAYKHQQMVEMLPFFVRPDFQTEDNLKALCRVPHLLRTSPAFTRGNISRPYPMHLGIESIEDLLCILDLD
jgi:RNaseH domain of pPIWI_RE/pPIWI_RE module N-terminal domain